MKPIYWTGACLLPLTAIVSQAETADYLNVEQAQKELVPNADSFVAETITISKEQQKAIKALSGLRQRWSEQQAWQAKKDGKLIAWLIMDNVIGKHEFITYMAALSPSGEVLGVEVLTYRETHGGEVQSPDWLSQFKGKNLDNVFKLDVDVRNISGATLSCRNLLDGVKRLLALQQEVLAPQS